MLHQEYTRQVVTVDHILIFVVFLIDRWGLQLLALFFHLILPLVEAFFFLFYDSLDALLVLAVGVSTTLCAYPLNRFYSFPTFELHRLKGLCAHRN